jgi:hypothetical protein
MSLKAMLSIRWIPMSALPLQSMGFLYSSLWRRKHLSTGWTIPAIGSFGGKMAKEEYFPTRWSMNIPKLWKGNGASIARLPIKADYALAFSTEKRRVY